jgi:hypothetical protein
VPTQPEERLNGNPEQGLEDYLIAKSPTVDEKYDKSPTEMDFDEKLNAVHKIVNDLGDQNYNKREIEEMARQSRMPLVEKELDKFDKSWDYDE